MSKTLIHSYDMSCFEDDFGKKEKNDAERTRKAEIKKVELLAVKATITVTRRL